MPFELLQHGVGIEAWLSPKGGFGWSHSRLAVHTWWPQRTRRQMHSRTYTPSGTLGRTWGEGTVRPWARPGWSPYLGLGSPLASVRAPPLEGAVSLEPSPVIWGPSVHLLHATRPQARASAHENQTKESKENEAEPLPTSAFVLRSAHSSTVYFTWAVFTYFSKYGSHFSL